MEINITEFFENEDPCDYSDSIANSGRDDIASVTWENAMDRAREDLLISDDEDIAEAKEYFQGFGAWDAEEIAEWDAVEVNALLIQFIAGEIREFEHFEDWEDYTLATECGEVSGHLFKGDDGEIYIYIGM